MGLINSDCTIYRREYNDKLKSDVFIRIYVPECWWYLQNKSEITNSGLQDANVLTVRIFNTGIKIKKGDYIVKGNGTDIGTIKDLKNHDYYKITLSNVNNCGGEPHIKVVAS